MLEGLDVSSHQGTINWKAVAQSGKSFAFIRVSDGAAFADPQFAANWAGAKAAGIARGAYQFFRPTENASAQAELLLQRMGRMQPGDLPPTLDVETLCAAPATQCTGISPDAAADGVSTWVDRVTRATGVMPILYTSPGFWSMLPSRGLEQRTVPWISHWYVGQPQIPGSWKRWAFWQYTDKGTVPGIQGAVDLDRFSGDAAELRALTRAGGRASRGLEIAGVSGATIALFAVGAVLLLNQSGKK